jgi:hypothetical protein
MTIGACEQEPPDSDELDAACSVGEDDVDSDEAEAECEAIVFREFEDYDADTMDDTPKDIE